MNKYKIIYKRATGEIMMSVGWYGDKYCAIRRIKHFNPECSIITISIISKDYGRL